ncbi:GIY-YIG nuclease family protein [Rhizobium sp. S152]|uniref:GIY-YIG nuclease family protein n=1 Tax=Halobaculum lipolyticum TaxID=3032001 RepID=A0ABD5WAV3_9EURY|nr:MULTISPECIES: GIY-YIG nuclease family protein [Bacteria]MDM9627411.1 GIY-YIG nuclease family protein [Rhizobium sp. S152]
MPIDKNWSKANPRHIKQNVPQSKGIYELKSFGKPVYVGSSNDLRRRLLEHLSERNGNVNRYRFKTLGFLSNRKKVERKHYDRHEEKYGKPPAWNERRP